MHAHSTGIVFHVEKMRPCRGLGAEMEWAQGVRVRGYRRWVEGASTLNGNHPTDGM